VIRSLRDRLAAASAIIGMTAENRPSLAQLCHDQPPVTTTDFINLVWTYAKAEGKLVNGFPVDLAGGRSAFLEEVFSAFHQSMGEKVTITGDLADPYHGSIHAAFHYEVIHPMTRPGVLALVHQPPRPQPNPPPITVSYPPQVAPVRQPPPRTVQPPPRAQGPPPGPPARPIAHHGDLPPEVREANTLYMSKLPDYAAGQPLALLQRLNFPANLVNDPEVKVRQGPYGAYFIMGPPSNPTWADQVMAHKHQSLIRDTKVHLNYARRRQQRPNPHDREQKEREVDEQLRKEFAGMTIGGRTQDPHHTSHERGGGAPMGVANEGANTTQVSGSTNGRNNKRKGARSSEQAVGSETGLTSPLPKAQKGYLTPSAVRHPGSQHESPGRSMATSPPPVGNLFNSMQTGAEGNGQDHDDADDGAGDDDHDREMVEVEDDSDLDN
jgi:hypothetical protein